MPPASSHLADRPVPAPPPMIGSPRSLLPRNRLRMSLRLMRDMILPWGGAGDARAGDLVEVVDQCVDEGLIVDVVGQDHQPPVGAGAEAGRQNVEQRLVRRRIPERL